MLIQADFASKATRPLRCCRTSTRFDDKNRGVDAVWRTGHAMGCAALLQEFRPTLYVKADRPSVQLMARVVLPRSIDRGSGQPITSLLRGDLYSDVGNWQQLTIRDIGRLLEQETRALRTQF